MAKKDKELLSQLTSEGAKGPFVTIMLNTHVAHQDVEKDQIKFKNFAKEAKKRFEKKYSEHDWSPFQEKIENLLGDPSFWRSATTSVAVIITADQTYIHRLSIPVDDQYYVSDLPYLLAIIKNGQFNYSYYLLGLNRDSMKLYEVSNKQVKEVSLPEGAPVDVVTVLGSELTGGGLNFSSNGGGGARFIYSLYQKIRRCSKKSPKILTIVQTLRFLLLLRSYPLEISKKGRRSCQVNSQLKNQKNTINS